MNSDQKTDLIQKILSLHVRVVKIKDKVNDVNNSLHTLMQELVQSREPTVLDLNHEVNLARLRNLNISR